MLANAAAKIKAAFSEDCFVPKKTADVVDRISSEVREYFMFIVIGPEFQAPADSANGR